MSPGFDFTGPGAALTPILHGSVTTILLTLISGLAGTMLAIAAAAASRSGRRGVTAGIACYVEAIRNTPFLVQLFVIFFVLPTTGLKLDPFPAACLAMTINLGAYGTEIVAAGLDGVARGQREAAMALGLRPYIVFTRITLPQALKIIFPALTSQFVITMLESAVVSQIAVRELTYEGDMIQARTFRAFETYLVIAAIYLALSLVLRRAVTMAGQKFLPRGIA